MHYVQVSVGGASWQRSVSGGHDRCRVRRRHTGPRSSLSSAMSAPICDWFPACRGVTCKNIVYLARCARTLMGRLRFTAAIGTMRCSRGYGSCGEAADVQYDRLLLWGCGALKVLPL